MAGVSELGEGQEGGCTGGRGWRHTEPLDFIPRACGSSWEDLQQSSDRIELASLKAGLQLPAENKGLGSLTRMKSAVLPWHGPLG